MIYSKIYNIKIQKETEKLFNLGGQNLIDLQNKYIKTISKMLGKWYVLVLEELKKNNSISFNDLFIDQTQFITKYYNQSDLTEFSNMMKKGFNIGAKQLNKSFSKDIRVDTTFNVDPADALKYANEYAGSKITGIDDYSKKRINGIISQGIEKGRGYKKLAKEIKADYSFSDYRARLIATQEIGEAYLNGKDTQFKKYTTEYGQKGWKHWISHRDARTTAGCLKNDNQGRIEADQEFQSGNQKPTRFIGCRCNIVYRLFDPRENGQELTTENADAVDLEQSEININDTFNEGIEPTDYNKYSTKIVPPSFFNAIGIKINYIKPTKRGYWLNFGKQLNVSTQSNEIKKQYTEVHELGHAFFDNVILNDEIKKEAFKKLYTESVEEFLEQYKNKDLTDIFRLSGKYGNSIVAKKIIEKIPKLGKIKGYKIETKKYTIKTPTSEREIEELIISDKLYEDVAGFYDTLGAITKESIGYGHGAKYYRGSETTFFIKLKSGSGDRITHHQAHEFFAHLNEAYFLGNDMMKEFLPKTYKSMKSFYKSIGYDDFI